MLRIASACAFVAAIGTLAGCATYFHALTPEGAHENFLQNLHSYVGEDIDANKGWLRRELNLSQERLPDGSLRYRFGVIGQCVKVFDVDASSHKIVAATFEGTKQQCAIPL